MGRVVEVKEVEEDEEEEEVESFISEGDSFFLITLL